MRIGPELFFQYLNTIIAIILVIGLVMFVIALIKIPGRLARKAMSAKNTEDRLDAIEQKLAIILERGQN